MTSTAPHLPIASASAPDVEGRWLAPPDALSAYQDRTEPAIRDRAVWSVAEALFVSEKGPPPTARLAWLCDDLRDFLQHAGRRARTLFRFALWVCTWIAPLLLGWLPPFHRRTLDERTRILSRLEHGAMWQTAIVLALKSILSILYFEHPDAAREIGFDGACKGLER